MVCLSNNARFPENAEWCYLYAVADVYKNYSSAFFLKTNITEPHPLTDKEVAEILNNKYGLKNVHRNTIANTRSKLEKYFGFEFGINKKGKYLVRQAGGLQNEECLLMASFIIQNSPLISSKMALNIINYLSSLTSSTEIKNCIESVIKTRVCKRDNDNFEKFVILSKAIANRQRIIFDSPTHSELLEVIPQELKVIKDELSLDYKYVCTNNQRHLFPYDHIPLNNINVITVVKRGRPRKKIPIASTLGNED